MTPPEQTTASPEASTGSLAVEQVRLLFRFSLVGLVLIFLGVSFLLYSRMARRIREDRRVMAALVRELRRKH